MNTEEIKAYVVEQLELMEAMPSFDRGSRWYDGQLRLRQLWIQAEQADALNIIASNLDTFRINGLPIENVHG